jgi:2-oxoisovalerate dehydrogenase E1 component alpha subunit
MITKSRLQIPRPTARPGDEPDFSYLDLSPAGSIDKPAIGARTRDIENLSSGLVRVLDDDFTAKGPWDPKLDPTQLQVALRWMMLTRALDERMWQIQRQGRISFYIQSLGEELSNTRDMCKGRQLPIMYHAKAGNVFSISGNLATQFPQAVGWAMASALKGEDHIAASWVGDGSTAEADFHYALTFAAVYQAPVILVVPGHRRRTTETLRRPWSRPRHSGDPRRRQ